MENGVEEDEVKFETTAAADDGEEDDDSSAEAISSRVASRKLASALDSGGSKLGSIVDLLGTRDVTDDCVEAPTVAAGADEPFKSIGVVGLEVDAAAKIALTPESTVGDAEPGFPCLPSTIVSDTNKAVLSRSRLSAVVVGCRFPPKDDPACFFTVVPLGDVSFVLSLSIFELDFLTWASPLESKGVSTVGLVIILDLDTLVVLRGIFCSLAMNCPSGAAWLPCSPAVILGGATSERRGWT